MHSASLPSPKFRAVGPARSVGSRDRTHVRRHGLGDRQKPRAEANAETQVGAKVEGEGAVPEPACKHLLAQGDGLPPGAGTIRSALGLRSQPPLDPVAPTGAPSGLLPPPRGALV